MPGRPPEVEHVKRTFKAEVASARTLVDAVKTIPPKVRPTAAIGLHPKHLEQIVELAFMGVVSAWEEFLERTLVRYAAGAKCASTYAPTPKFGLANSMDHAYIVLSQNPGFNSTKDYLKANDPRWVRSTAEFLFSTHPYGCLQNKTELIKHASSIRNRVAHNSTKCRADFKATAIYFTQPPNDTLPQGYNPGKLLLSTVTRHFDRHSIQQRISHIAAYFRMFELMADEIVP